MRSRRRSRSEAPSFDDISMTLLMLYVLAASVAAVHQTTLKLELARVDRPLTAPVQTGNEVQILIEADDRVFIRLPTGQIQAYSREEARDPGFRTRLMDELPRLAAESRHLVVMPNPAATFQVTGPLMNVLGSIARQGFTHEYRFQVELPVSRR